ncbi:MAG: hypothetical protein ACM34K_01750 [Bacillota bacterium]
MYIYLSNDVTDQAYDMALDELEKTIELLFITSDPDYIYTQPKSQNLENPRIFLRIVKSSDFTVPLLYLGHVNNISKADLIILDSNLNENELRILVNYFRTNPLFNCTPLVLSVNSFEEKEKLRLHGIKPDCFIPQDIDKSRLLKLIFSSRSFWLSIIRSQSILTQEKYY